MSRYRAIMDTWLSHENRKAVAGEEFDTTFPNGPDGKPMRLGANLELVKAKKQDATGPEQALV